MKLYISQPMHPHTRFLKVVINFSDQKVEEIPLNEEESATKLKHGSVVSLEKEGQEYFEYWEIAKILLSSKEALLGTSNFE